MAALVPFTPSASITVQAGVAQGETVIGGRGHYMRIVNQGPGTVWLAFFEPTDLPPALNANYMAMIGGAIETFSIQSDTTMIAYLGDGQGSTLNFTRGEGG